MPQAITGGDEAIKIRGQPAQGPDHHATRPQAQTLELALRLLESAAGPQTTMQSPFRWASDPAWKNDYNNVALLSTDELARRRAEFDKQKDLARGVRETVA